MTGSNHHQQGAGATAKAQDAVEAVIVRQAFFADVVKTCGVFHVEHVGPREECREEYLALRDRVQEFEEREQSLFFSGRRQAFLRASESLRARMRSMVEVKSRDTILNLVTTPGKNDMEDKYFAGSAYTATPRMGLKGVGAAALADTQASHAGWLEQGLANAPVYTGSRPTPSFSAAAAGVKTTSAVVSFSFTSSGTVAGVFISNGGSTTKDDTSGVLFSAGDFTNGTKAVVNGDMINVTYSFTLT